MDSLLDVSLIYIENPNFYLFCVTQEWAIGHGHWSLGFLEFFLFFLSESLLPVLTKSFVLDNLKI